ncbi:MAG: DNA mismatch repair protein MutS, partial [bacterium]
PADHSYGIAVAKLAGLPSSVIRRARQVLAGFERCEADGVLRLSGVTPPGLPLAADRDPEDPVRSELRDIDLDKLSPLEALNLLARLQRAARENTKPDA